MRRFGLLGYPLSHSFSQKYFTEKFTQLGLTDCVYENFSLPDIKDLSVVLKERFRLLPLSNHWVIGR